MNILTAPTVKCCSLSSDKCTVLEVALDKSVCKMPCIHVHVNVKSQGRTPLRVAFGIVAVFVVVVVVAFLFCGRVEMWSDVGGSALFGRTSAECRCEAPSHATLSQGTILKSIMLHIFCSVPAPTLPHSPAVAVCV